VETTIIECDTHITSKEVKELEVAEKKLKKILEKNKEYVPALVAMGLCKFILKKSSEARNYLKTVTQQEFQLEFAEYFERAWLLSADYYISVNKFDLAEAELKKVLKYNKSNVKAEELMGLIKEKEKAYVDAAEHYDKAFKMSNNKNANVGFRLAFNYLKANRFVDTIDVGKEILKVHPDYPKLKTELIDKARSMIKN
jgi:tetratricopeptide repeat protein 21B